MSNHPTQSQENRGSIVGSESSDSGGGTTASNSTWREQAEHVLCGSVLPLEDFADFVESAASNARNEDSSDQVSALRVLFHLGQISALTIINKIPDQPLPASGAIFPRRAISFLIQHHHTLQQFCAKHPAAAILSIHPDVLATVREDGASRLYPGMECLTMRLASMTEQAFSLAKHLASESGLPVDVQVGNTLESSSATGQKADSTAADKAGSQPEAIRESMANDSFVQSPKAQREASFESRIFESNLANSVRGESETEYGPSCSAFVQVRPVGSDISPRAHSFELVNKMQVGMIKGFSISKVWVKHEVKPKEGLVAKLETLTDLFDEHQDTESTIANTNGSTSTYGFGVDFSGDGRKIGLGSVLAWGALLGGKIAASFGYAKTDSKADPVTRKGIRKHRCKLHTSVPRKLLIFEIAPAVEVGDQRDWFPSQGLPYELRLEVMPLVSAPRR
ncbi:hypothetical protein NCC49_000529 [Naganishia albida]|nr:hypothetical protein NCC49_000529 [Naganishia albida]